MFCKMYIGIALHIIDPHQYYMLMHKRVQSNGKKRGALPIVVGVNIVIGSGAMATFEYCSMYLHVFIYTAYYIHASLYMYSKNKFFY